MSNTGIHKRCKFGPEGKLHNVTISGEQERSYGTDKHNRVASIHSINHVDYTQGVQHLQYVLVMLTTLKFCLIVSPVHTEGSTISPLAWMSAPHTGSGTTLWDTVKQFRQTKFNIRNVHVCRATTIDIQRLGAAMVDQCLLYLLLEQARLVQSGQEDH